MHKFKLIAIALLLALILPLFAGCQTLRSPDALYQDELSDELKTTIKHKIVLKYDEVIYWGKTTASWQEPYYGTINDWIIVQSNGTDKMSIDLPHPDYELAGYTFEEGGEFFALYAYRDGEVWELKEAYEQGILTKAQIQKIHKRHQDIYADLIKAREDATKN